MELNTDDQLKWIEIINKENLIQIEKYIQVNSIHFDEHFPLKYALENKKYYVLKKLCEYEINGLDCETDIISWFESDLRKKIAWTLIWIFGNANELNKVSLIVAAIKGNKTIVKYLINIGTKTDLIIKFVKDPEMIDLIKNHMKNQILLVRKKQKKKNK